MASPVETSVETSIGTSIGTSVRPYIRSIFGARKEPAPAAAVLFDANACSALPGQAPVADESVVLRHLWKALSGVAILGAIFYFEAFFSVSDYPPGSVPVHHDDYTNYARGMVAFQWSWNRPLSTWLIHLLGIAGPAWLIGAVRVLSIVFVLLSWALLCQLLRPRAYWLMLPAFAVAVLSTPVIVEYARYTGMITHLLSGSLGIAAVLALFRASDMSREPHPAKGRRLQGWYLLSVTLVVLSVLAKEDFILLYALSLVFAGLWWPARRTTLLVWGFPGLMICTALIGASKLFASTIFLGVAEASSTYYLNLTPASVAHAVWRYLTGAAHPAMQAHGRVVFAIFIASALIAFWLTAIRRGASRSLYFVLAVLALIAPYAVLPNHVNVYYELIWLPMLIAGAVAAATEMVESMAVPSVWHRRMPLTIMLAIAAVFTFVDNPGRSGIAAWYDERTRVNARVLEMLDMQRARINAAPAVCVSGADSFSPWFMHDGQYLSNVMGLDATWIVLVAPDSPLRVGFELSAAESRGTVIVADSADEFTPGCVHLRIDQ